MSDALTTEQKEALKKVLEKKQDELLSHAKEGLELTMNRVPDSGRDSIDESSDEELISTELRLRDREVKLLGKIREALKRIEENTINVCEDCEGPIGVKRLLVRPMTTLCIACKELSEAAETTTQQARTF